MTNGCNDDCFYYFEHENFGDCLLEYHNIILPKYSKVENCSNYISINDAVRFLKYHQFIKIEDD